MYITTPEIRQILKVLELFLYYCDTGLCCFMFNSELPSWESINTMLQCKYPPKDIVKTNSKTNTHIAEQEKLMLATSTVDATIHKFGGMEGFHKAFETFKEEEMNSDKGIDGYKLLFYLSQIHTSPNFNSFSAYAMWLGIDRRTLAKYRDLALKRVAYILYKQNFTKTTQKAETNA